jgi:hypothetical protein
MLFAMNKDSESRIYVGRCDKPEKCTMAMSGGKYTRYEMHDIRNNEWFEFTKNHDNIFLTITKPDDRILVSIFNYEDALRFVKKETFFQRLARCM